MIDPQWLEQPISRTNFHGPKDFRALEVRLYYYILHKPKTDKKNLSPKNKNQLKIQVTWNIQPY